VYAVNPTGDTAAGNFVGGLLTGVLAVPCTGPLLGATVAWIATQPPALGLSTFLVMGLGMAAPYALLIAFPKLLSRMPRGGPGGELLGRSHGNNFVGPLKP
jgi:thiol:disulfide interchange protein DsbD